MHSKNLIVLIFLILFSNLFSLLSFAQNVPIVAEVNNEQISLETMIHAKNELPQEIQSQPFINYYEGLLERVIDIKLIAQEGRKNSIQNEPSVKAAIEFVTEKVLMQAYLSKFIQENITEENLRTCLLYTSDAADE